MPFPEISQHSHDYSVYCFEVQSFRAAACDMMYLDVDEGGEVELMFGPLTHKELVTLPLR